MDVGGVGCLRNVKNAISVARHVLENTAHSLIVGDLATDFALRMGYANESLETYKSKAMWENWRANNCQPNFWKVLSIHNIVYDIYIHLIIKLKIFLK